MDLELKTEKREILGREVKSLREKGLIPAELYGNGIENVHLSIEEDEFKRVYKEGGESTLIYVKFDNESRPVLIHNVQLNPINGSILAVDLYEVNMKEKISTNVPLDFIGEAPAVEDVGGVLITSLDEVEIEALPINIPHDIKVDLSVLDEIGKSIQVSDLLAGDKFEILTEGDITIASIAEPREEEEEPEEEMSVEDIEVEGEKKEDGSEEGAAEEGKPSGDE
ncbi:MAG: 50S ribosomal protein L25 [Candidatus Colwellbacteria bacterium CG10_big_fil_rev_8_21_14_0_10_41_28]|uniref:Large ribosomal subunit protein bL25 n=1 Tax=Candidatus Colwellbacteria bacterium CG10_big_fil_rev_8_21_14_0_10_41_28 TaxID=1974539 RepID=A0A2H0VHM7_9BACT|nr:MAG: 50S ribosomal protein L25 [Candidatus Colwellbacteria bacterium CG10_big_fil_rev_8_21_14_0_10_41_28]